MLTLRQFYIIKKNYDRFKSLDYTHKCITMKRIIDDLNCTEQDFLEAIKIIKEE